jgi:hypothetical protein
MAGATCSERAKTLKVGARTRVNDEVSPKLKVECSTDETRRNERHNHGFLIVDFLSVQAVPKSGSYCSSALKAIHSPLLSIHISTTGSVVVKENHKKQKASVDDYSQASDRSIDSRLACRTTSHRTRRRRPQP